MTLRTFGTLIATALVLTAVPAVTATADPASARKVKVSVSLPATLVEGDRFTVVAKVSKPSEAKQVQLLRATTGGWELVAKTKVRKKKSYSFQDVAGSLDVVRYRVKVVLDGGGAVASQPAQAAVWHWTPMTDFDPYYGTPGVEFGNNVHITLNGVSYRGGWETTGKSGPWETRITPGRNCRAFRGVVGVTDESADGSSAVLSLVTDETTTVYQSPPLTPGAAVPVQLDLATPYRLAVRAQRTSAPPLSAFPAIATPELLCTGLG